MSENVWWHVKNIAREAREEFGPKIPKVLLFAVLVVLYEVFVMQQRPRRGEPLMPWLSYYFVFGGALALAFVGIFWGRGTIRSAVMGVWGTPPVRLVRFVFGWPLRTVAHEVGGQVFQWVVFLLVFVPLWFLVGYLCHEGTAWVGEDAAGIAFFVGLVVIGAFAMATSELNYRRLLQGNPKPVSHEPTRKDPPPPVIVITLDGPVPSPVPPLPPARRDDRKSPFDD